MVGSGTLHFLRDLRSSMAARSAWLARQLFINICPHGSQYISLDAAGRNLREPHRSQYFSS
jgi:hypothetical protein